METPCFYAVIPANVRYCTELEPNAKLLYGEITALTQKEGYCWASNKYFADLYKVCERTVTNWLQSLEKEGFIEIQTHKNGLKWERKIWIFQNIFTKGKNFPIDQEKNFQIDRKKISTDVIHKGILHKEQQQDARDPSSASTSDNIHYVVPSPQAQGSVNTSKPAAVSSEKKEKVATPPPKLKSDPPKPPPAPKCYDCLKDVLIDPDPKIDAYEKEWLTKHYPEDIVENAIKWLQTNKQPVKLCVAAILKWICRDGVKTRNSPIQEIEENKVYASQLERDLLSLQCESVRFDVMNKQVEFTFLGCAKEPIAIYFMDSSFKVKLEEHLKKYGFKFKNETLRRKTAENFQDRK